MLYTIININSIKIMEKEQLPKNSKQAGTSNKMEDLRVNETEVKMRHKKVCEKRNAKILKNRNLLTHPVPFTMVVTLILLFKKMYHHKACAHPDMLFKM